MAYLSLCESSFKTYTFIWQILHFTLFSFHFSFLFSFFVGCHLDVNRKIVFYNLCEHTSKIGLRENFIHWDIPAFFPYYWGIESHWKYQMESLKRFSLTNVNNHNFGKREKKRFRKFNTFDWNWINEWTSEWIRFFPRWHDFHRKRKWSTETKSPILSPKQKIKSCLRSQKFGAKLNQ